MSTTDETPIPPPDDTLSLKVLQMIVDAFGLAGRKVIHFSAVWEIGRPVIITTLEQMTDTQGRVLAGKFKAIEWVPKLE